jgi:hypothetical protein
MEWVIAAFVVVCATVWYIRKRVRAARRADLATRYGEQLADLIMAQKICQGMTAEHVRESWGLPVDIDQNVLKTKIKETWKYQQTGKGRFANRVFLEGGVVVGWKDSH